MKISELDDMLTADLAVTEDDIVKASLETPTLHAKWMKFMTDQGYKVHALKQKMDRLKKAKWKYYTGRATAGVYAKNPFHEKLRSNSEIEIWIDGDDDILNLKDNIYREEMLFNRLSEAVKTIQFRHMNIKNAVEWHKLQSGLV